MSNFFNAIRADIAFDVRKDAPSSFQEACELAKQVESAYNESNFEEINTMKNKDKNLYENLIESSQQNKDLIKQLKEETDNLKKSKREKHAIKDDRFPRNEKLFNKYNNYKVPHNSNNFQYDDFGQYDHNYSNFFNYPTHFGMYDNLQPNWDSGNRDFEYISENYDQNFHQFEQPKRKRKKANNKANFDQISGFLKTGIDTVNQTIANITNADKDSLPIISIIIQDVKIKVLLDTGATVSLLVPSLFKEIKDTNVKIKYLDNQIQIQILKISKISFKQCVKLTFRLKGIFTKG